MPATLLYPRIDRVLVMLERLAPSSLLDIGSGRGTFVRPLVVRFPELRVTATDVDAQRVDRLRDVARQHSTLSVARMDATHLAFADDAFDAVTVLEVLEHLRDPAKAAREALRVASRFIIASVPSKPDSNPDHVRWFTPTTLADLFVSSGARGVTIEHVPGHIIARIACHPGPR